MVTKETARKRKKILLVVIAIIVGLLLVGTCVCLFILGTPLKAQEKSLSIYNNPSANVEVETNADGYIAFSPANMNDVDTGVVFYQGARVDIEAYSCLFNGLAAQGVLAIGLKSPMNFAILNQDAAIKVIEKYPQIKSWYLAGHSLGGVAASNCLAAHPDAFSGIIFCASYPANDLTKVNPRVLTVLASNDKICTQDKVESAKSKLPIGSREFVIRCGNHAQFGDYGPQQGDGEATISYNEQNAQLVDQMLKFVKEE
ncbi:MAG: alpha/beta hydrolase [Coriobacteriales bacterium]|nr:alpha/beta hydrolase [Coriobacteriales bacterium]